jgi:DNA-binding FadR family transcriptional regulator
VSPPASARADTGFRVENGRLVDAAGNGLVSIVTRPVFNVVQRRFRREAAPKRFWADVVDAHERILRSIEEGDEEGEWRHEPHGPER